jgi:hypothetical protein
VNSDKVLTYGLIGVVLFLFLRQQGVLGVGASANQAVKTDLSVRPPPGEDPDIWTQFMTAAGAFAGGFVAGKTTAPSS